MVVPRRAQSALAALLAHWATARFRHRRRPRVFLQFPLKSRGFSSAELQGCDFCSEKWDAAAKLPRPRRTRRRGRLYRERASFLIHNGRLAAPNGLQRSPCSLTFASPVSATGGGEARPSRALLGIFDSLRDCERTTKISSQPHTLFVFVVIPRSARSWVHSVPTPSWRGMPGG